MENAKQDVYSEQSIQTNITIHTDKKVEFLWPNEKFPILRANANTGDTLVIASDTTSGKFSLTGDVNIRGGEIFYFQRNFYIREGNLHFQENEINFAPRLSAVADTRDQAKEGPVTISIIVDNQTIDNLTPVIESNPPLSQIEIISILGSSLSGTTVSTNTQEIDPANAQDFARSLVSSATDALTQFQLVRRVERYIRDFLHVDIFSARTQALQNAILQYYLFDTDEDTVRIGAYFDNTTLMAGKYITGNFYVQAMAAMDYDKYKTDYGGLNLEAYISVELDSPILNMSWEINPLHKRSLWIEDNKITITKSWHLP